MTFLFHVMFSSRVRIQHPLCLDVQCRWNCIRISFSNFPEGEESRTARIEWREVKKNRRFCEHGHSDHLDFCVMKLNQSAKWKTLIIIIIIIIAKDFLSISSLVQSADVRNGNCCCLNKLRRWGRFSLEAYKRRRICASQTNCWDTVPGLRPTVLPKPKERHLTWPPKQFMQS